MKDYKKALALGGSRPLPELFKAAGCGFRFDRQAIQPLVRLMRDELAKLDGEQE
jgi:oligoendopeptidase F